MQFLFYRLITHHLLKISHRIATPQSNAKDKQEGRFCSGVFCQRGFGVLAWSQRIETSKMQILVKATRLYLNHALGIEP
jgi:hypothetical protein